MELLGSADVVIESQGVGDLQGFGISRDELRAQHPALVVATISGFGTTGPYASYRWSDLVAQVASWIDLPPGSIARGAGEAPPVSSPSARSVTPLRSARSAGVIRARHSGAGAHVDCAAYRGPRHHSRARVPVPRLGVRGARTPAARGERGRHVAPHRRLPVRRRLRVDDVDAAAARRDALGARRRRPPRGVRPSRRVREPGDQGDPRLRAVPVAVRAHARRGHRGGAGGGLAVRRRVLARRGAGGRPLAPARVLGRVRRPDASGPCCCPAPRTGTRRVAGSSPSRAGGADQRQGCGRGAPAGAPGDRAGP